MFALIPLLPELIALFYGWWFYAELDEHCPKWRSRLSLAVLVIVTVSVPLLIAAIVTSPMIKGTDALRDDYVADCRPYVLRVLAVTLLASFFQRGKLILPTVVAILGSGLFWIGSVP